MPHQVCNGDRVRFTVVLRAELHQALKEAAEQEELPMSVYVRRIIREKVAWRAGA